jgi:ribonuclease-3
VNLLKSEPAISDLAARLDHDFADGELLAQAMAHRSWCAEQGGKPSNERLEFLGDAVLGLVISDYSYCSYPDFPEGEMAKLRAAVVNAAVLAEAAALYGIGEALLLGKGEDLSGGRDKRSILADAFEALIGALYLDGGLVVARAFILEALGSRVASAAQIPGVDDYKTRLQEMAARQFDGILRYDIEEDGPDHRKRFVATVSISGAIRGVGEGRSKKEAEQEAARQAWDALGSETDTELLSGTHTGSEMESDLDA